jgi:hypothetical protein
VRLETIILAVLLEHAKRILELSRGLEHDVPSLA